MGGQSGPCGICIHCKEGWCLLSGIDIVGSNTCKAYRARAQRKEVEKDEMH